MQQSVLLAHFWHTATLFFVSTSHHLPLVRLGRTLLTFAAVDSELSVVKCWETADS